MLQTGRLLAPQNWGLCRSASALRSLPTPGTSYRGPWHLPGPDSHRLTALSLSSGYTTNSFLVAPELLDARVMQNSEASSAITSPTCEDTNS
jgi:hypothetical protein